MHRFLCSTAISLMLPLLATPALAQAPRPERPYRGLFGGGTGETEQSLTVEGSFGGGYDDNLAADARGSSTQLDLSDFSRSLRGGLGQFSGNLSYSLNGDRFTVNAAAGTDARYYPSLSTRFFRRDNVRAGASMRIGKGLSAIASAAYRPYSLASLFPTMEELTLNETDPALPDGEFASSNQHYLSYSGGLGYNRRLSQRTEFAASYDYRVRESSATLGKFSSHGGGALLTHQVAKGLGLRAGYRYSEAQYSESAPRQSVHVIDAGVDYSKNLSFSRRTMLSFGTGMSAFTEPDAVAARTRFRANGSAVLDHEIGRTWNARVTYQRGVYFSEGWPEPVFSDGVMASLSGLFSRALQFESSVRASTGRVGFHDGLDGFDGFYGTVQLQYALSRYVSLSSAYSYYWHRFDEAATLPVGFPNQVDRQSVRWYVSVWAPLFQKLRRADATR